MYPEGGLTTDGKLREPRLGLLDYVLKGFDPAAARDLVFIPVGINYDRVLEDRSLLRKLDPSAAGVGLLRKLAIVARLTSRQSFLAALGRRYRHGYACVNFGTPVSMRSYVAARGLDFRALDDAGRRDPFAAVGRMLMARIRQVVPVLPVPLVASVLLRDEARAISELEPKAAVQAPMDGVEVAGMSTRRAPTATTRSPSACACLPCAARSRGGTACSWPTRAS